MKGQYDDGIVTSGIASVQKTYGNKLTFEKWPFNEQVLVTNLVDTAGVASELTKGAPIVAELKEKLKEIADPPDAAANFPADLDCNHSTNEITNPPTVTASPV